MQPRLIFKDFAFKDFTVTNTLAMQNNGMNRVNEYYNNYLENVPMKITSHGLTQKQHLTKRFLMLIFQWKAGNSAAVKYTV